MHRTFHCITSRIWFYWVVGKVCSSWNMDVACPGALPRKLAGFCHCIARETICSMQKLWCFLAQTAVGAHNPQGWAGKTFKLQTQLHFSLPPTSLLQWTCHLVGGNPSHPNWSLPFLNCVKKLTWLLPVGAFGRRGAQGLPLHRCLC